MTKERKTISCAVFKHAYVGMLVEYENVVYRIRVINHPLGVMELEEERFPNLIKELNQDGNNSKYEG